LLYEVKVGWETTCRTRFSTPLRSCDDILNTIGERFYRKRPCQDLHAGFEVSVSDRRVLRVTCDEQNFQDRTVVADGIGKVTPIHARQETNIGDRKVDACFALLEHSRIWQPLARGTP
jgi:hypothetical protein